MHPQGACNGVRTKMKWDKIMKLEPSPIQMYVQDGELAGCYWTDRIKEHIKECGQFVEELQYVCIEYNRQIIYRLLVFGPCHNQ